MGFFVPARRTPQCDVNIARGFRQGGRGKDRQASRRKMLGLHAKLQSSELGPSRPGPRRETLTVLAPRRLSLLARTQITGVQTIPFKQDTL
jgi:hypothetical protein